MSCTFDFSLYFISFPLDVIQAYVSKVLKLLSLAFPHICTLNEKLCKGQNLYNFTFLPFFALQNIIIWLTLVTLMKLYFQIISYFSLWVEDVLQYFFLWLSLTFIPADYPLPLENQFYAGLDLHTLWWHFLSSDSLFGLFSL